jgi:hypothetical protein
MIEHLDAVAIFHKSGFFEDGGNAVAEDNLDSGDVGDFEYASAAVLAGHQREGYGGAEKGGGDARQRFGKEFHGTRR